MALWRSSRSPASTKVPSPNRIGRRAQFMLLLVGIIICSMAVYRSHPHSRWRFPLHMPPATTRPRHSLSSSLTTLPTIPKKHLSSTLHPDTTHPPPIGPKSEADDTTTLPISNSKTTDPDDRSAEEPPLKSAAAPAPSQRERNLSSEFSSAVLEHFPGIAEKIMMGQIVPVEKLRELLEGVGQGRQVSATSFASGKSPVMATFASQAFEDFLLNWIEHVRRIGLGDLILVAALDKPTLEICRQAWVAALLVEAGLGEGDFRGLIGKFRAMGAPKVDFILRVLELGRDVIVSDTDTVWVADPLEFLARDGPVAGADICVTSDSLSPHHDELSMKARPDGCCWFEDLTPRAVEQFGATYSSSFNTGVLVVRSTQAAMNFTRTWFEVLRTSGDYLQMKDLYDDQDAFNRIMWHGMGSVQVVFPEDGSKPNNRILWMHDHLLKMGLLPPVLFCNGHVYFVQRAHERLNTQPFVVHNTFQFHFSGGKKLRFMEAGLWVHNNSYFDGKFLSFDAKVPPELLANEDNDVDRHIGAMEFYLLATRNALAIAHALGRILILPEVQCICDKFWQMTLPVCRLPGVDFDPPYICPGDHFINGNYLLKSSFPFRVHTFLKDPHLPADIIASRKVIRITTSRPEDEGVGALAPNSTDSQVQAALRPFDSARLLHLESAATAFSRFDKDKDNQWFQGNLGGTLGPEDWCCLAGEEDRYNASAHRTVQPPPPLFGEDYWVKTRWRPKQARSGQDKIANT